MINFFNETRRWTSDTNHIQGEGSNGGLRGSQDEVAPPPTSQLHIIADASKDDWAV